MYIYLSIYLSINLSIYLSFSLSFSQVSLLLSLSLYLSRFYFFSSVAWISSQTLAQVVNALRKNTGETRRKKRKRKGRGEREKERERVYSAERHRYITNVVFSCFYLYRVSTCVSRLIYGPYRLRPLSPFRNTCALLNARTYAREKIASGCSEFQPVNITPGQRSRLHDPPANHYYEITILLDNYHRQIR